MVRNFLQCLFQILLISAVPAFTPNALAQGSGSGHHYFAAKLGANWQSAEDNESGQSPGGGAALGFALNRRWTLEFEAWIPAYMRNDGTSFRDLLFSVSGVRRWKGRLLSPFLLIGLTLAKVQTRSRLGESSNGYSYFQAGFGVEIPLSERLAIAPEIRSNIALTAIVIRPAISTVVRF